MEKRSKEKIIPIEIYTDGSLKKEGNNLNFGGLILSYKMVKNYIMNLVVNMEQQINVWNYSRF